MEIYADNIFNKTPYATSINEIHLKAELNPDFHIDLLTIFNNIDVDESLIFMQLYGSQGYPIFKIYKDLLNNDNMQWISKWCKASQMEGKMEVAEDSTFDKLLVKIRLPNEDGHFKKIFQNDMAYFTLEIHPENALTNIRFYIKNDAHITIDTFKIIIQYANNFLEQCSRLNIYTIPLEYLQDGDVNTIKELKLFGTDENQINYFSAINFINISIQQYWSVLNVNIPRSLDTMNMLSQWLVNNLETNARMFNILITSNKLIDNHIPVIYRFNDNYINANLENIIKSVIKYLKKSKVSYSAYKKLLTQSTILNYLARLYRNIFNIIDKTWKEHMTKTTIVMKNYFNDDEVSTITQKISNLFGVTINIGLNNINVLGILNVNMMYIIENVLQNILSEFIKYYNNPTNNQADYNNNNAINLHNDIVNDDYYDFDNIDVDIDIDDIDFDNIKIDFNDTSDTITESVVDNKFKYAIDDSFFKVYEGYRGDDIDILQDIKYAFLDFERDIMAQELNNTNKKKQSALTRLKKFDQFISNSIKYASDCQSDKKPIIITNDEYKKLLDTINSKTGKLTPYGEYIRFIVNNAQHYENNPYYYYICCMIFDFHQRHIVNPYCVYVKIVNKLDSVYYIPFATANDLFVTEKWYPKGDNYINRYDETKIVKKDGKLYYPDPSNDNKLVEMIEIFPNISRFHCIDFNTSKNYASLPYKFIPNLVEKNDLPCCFSKTQVIPNTVSNYNNSLNANNEFYRKYQFKSYDDYVRAERVIYDGINRMVQLPPDLNILFNNKNEYVHKTMKNEWCRRIVFQGYFVSLFDFLLTNYKVENGQDNFMVIAHSDNNTMAIYKRPIYQLIWFLYNRLTDEQFMTMRNGLIRLMFNSKEEFIRYCHEHYFEINEELLWEWVSDLFDINIFIINKVNKHLDKKEIIPEYYMFEFPQGYDLDKLYSHKYSMFVYKYTNTKSEVIYDLIDKINIKERSPSINIDDFKPFIPSNYSFVQNIIKTLKQTNKQLFFDFKAKSHTPTAVEFLEKTNIKIIGQTRTHNLEYTDNVIFQTAQGSTVIMPVYPITLLPDTIKVYNNIKYPMYTRKKILDIITFINNNLNKSDPEEYWYYPRAIITNIDSHKAIGYIFDKNVQMYYKQITYPTGITPEKINKYDPTLQLIKQFFYSNNSIVPIEDKTEVDDDRDKYVSNKNLIKSIIFSVEYMLSMYLTPEWRELLRKYFSKDINKDWDQLGNDLYTFVERYIDVFTSTDPAKKYNINTSHMNISNIISSKDDNLITSFKGSPIKNCYATDNEEDCNNISICKWNKDYNMCEVCFNTEELKKNVINYIVNELLSSFNSIRYKIMYGSSFSTEPKVIQNYHPDKQYIINSRNATNAIDTLYNLIRGDKISSLAENMKIVYTLTHNFNAIQKQQISTLLRSLSNEIRSENLYHVDIPCLKDIYMVSMFNDSNDFWFTSMLQMAQRSGIVTIPDFRKALSDILIKNKFIRLRQGNSFIFNGYMIANFYKKYMHERGHDIGSKAPYYSLFDKIIDIFRSKDYQATYIDIQAMLMAPWNDYNIAIIRLNNYIDLDKETFKIEDDTYFVYDMVSMNATQPYYKNMVCKNLPENTSEEYINDIVYYKRDKYIVYLELPLNDGTTIFKQLVKYNSSINLQDFEFDKSEIDCIKEHTKFVDNEALLIGNIPRIIWTIGGTDDQGRGIIESACNNSNDII